MTLLRMWGRTREEALGRNCLELGYEPWHAAMHDREIERVVATRQPIRGEVPFSGTNGRRVYDSIMAKLLRPLGHQVLAAHVGPSAVDAARDFLPDFVLLDIGLPGMDGYQVAARLKAEPCLRGATVIAVSGYGQEEDRRRAREAGFDHHLVKPVDHDALTALFAARRGARPG